MTKKEMMQVLQNLPDDYDIVLTDEIFPMDGMRSAILKGRHILGVGLIEEEKKIFLFVHPGVLNFAAQQ
jgi:hypothetical protein